MTSFTKLLIALLIASFTLATWPAGSTGCAAMSDNQGMDHSQMDHSLMNHGANKQGQLSSATSIEFSAAQDNSAMDCCQDDCDGLRADLRNALLFVGYLERRNHTAGQISCCRIIFGTATPTAAGSSSWRCLQTTDRLNQSLHLAACW